MIVRGNTRRLMMHVKLTQIKKIQSNELKQ